MMTRNLKYEDVLSWEKQSKGNDLVINIVSNITLQPLLEKYLSYYLDKVNINSNITYSNFSNWDFKKQANLYVVLIRIQDWDLELYHNIHQKTEEEILIRIKDFEVYLSTFLNKLSMTSLPILFFNFEKDTMIEIDKGFNEIIFKLNEFIKDLINDYPNSYLLDINDVMAHIGIDNFYDLRSYYKHSCPYTKEACNYIAWKITKYVYSLQRSLKKCIILDCDGILWGGIAAEDSINNIKLGQLYPGHAYQVFQRYLLHLSKCGVILCLCSKNDESIVLDIFNNHNDMLLSLKDIAAYRINWNNKPDNIIELSKELNIGLDSMIFIDDNEYEIELVKLQLPMVETLLLKNNVHQFVQTLKDKGYFLEENKYNYTLNRTMAYKDQRQRLVDKERFGSDIVSYHKSLQMNLKIYIANEFSFPRIVELIKRVNQFNISGKRFNEYEIKHRMVNEKYCILCLEVSDKFGDMGIVGVAVLYFNKNNEVMIEGFYLSCRAFDRHFEKVLLNSIRRLAIIKKYETLIGIYQRTDKNQVFKSFYTSNHFQRIDDKYYLNVGKNIDYPDIYQKVEVSYDE
jgi:FkbH-like protein